MAPDLDPFCLLNRPRGKEDWWGSWRPGVSEICLNPDTAPVGQGPGCALMGLRVPTSSEEGPG